MMPMFSALFQVGSVGPRPLEASGGLEVQLSWNESVFYPTGLRGSARARAAIRLRHGAWMAQRCVLMAPAHCRGHTAMQSRDCTKQFKFSHWSTERVGVFSNPIRRSNSVKHGLFVQFVPGFSLLFPCPVYRLCFARVCIQLYFRWKPQPPG